jgi:hypothetical protein
MKVHLKNGKVWHFAWVPTHEYGSGWYYTTANNSYRIFFDERDGRIWIGRRYFTIRNDGSIAQGWFTCEHMLGASYVETYTAKIYFNYGKYSRRKNK